MSYYFVRAGNYHDKAKIARAVASNPKQDDIPTEHRSGGVWARMRTRVLLCGDRPPNCRWRPLQIRPLDRPVCLPLALSFAFVSIYPLSFPPILSLSPYSLFLFAISSFRTENCYVVGLEYDPSITALLRTKTFIAYTLYYEDAGGIILYFFCELVGKI